MYQTGAKKQEARGEDVFIEVNAIKDGKVYGVVANTPDFVTNYHRGDRLKFPESKVMNWVIVRPDGSEEGNFVGRFLERWKKPQ